MAIFMGKCFAFEKDSDGVETRHHLQFWPQNHHNSQNKYCYTFQEETNYAALYKRPFQKVFQKQFVHVNTEFLISP